MFDYVLRSAHRTPENELIVAADTLEYECGQLAAKLSALAQTAQDCGDAVTGLPRTRTASEIISSLVQDVLTTVGQLPLGRLTETAGKHDLLRLHLHVRTGESASGTTSTSLSTGAEPAETPGREFEGPGAPNSVGNIQNYTEDDTDSEGDTGA